MATRSLTSTALRSLMGGFALGAVALLAVGQSGAQAIGGHNSDAPVSYAADRIELHPSGQLRVVHLLGLEFDHRILVGVDKGIERQAHLARYIGRLNELIGDALEQTQARRHRFVNRNLVAGAAGDCIKHCQRRIYWDQRGCQGREG